MIAFLSGKIILSRSNYVILDTGGVGYKIYSANTGAKEGTAGSFYIYEHIREECHDLYGFGEFDDLELFTKLISVNGVGPKAGISIMNVYDKGKITQAIITENSGLFQSVPGIGKKVAAKIILELKSKIAGLESDNVIQSMNDGDEVIEAMSSLGYKKHEVAKIMSRMPSLHSTEEKIKWCLQHIK